MPAFSFEASSLDEIFSGIKELDTVSALARIGGNRRLYLELLKVFSNRQQQLIEKVREQLLQGDIHSAKRSAHTLKGLAGTIGANTLQELAKLLELAIHDGEPLDELLTKTEGELHKVVGVLQQLPSEESVQPTVKASPEQIRREQEILFEKLQSFDATADEAYANLLRLVQEPQLRKSIETMKIPIDEFDYVRAIALLEDIMVDQGTFTK